MPQALPFIVYVGGTALEYTALQVAVATFATSVVVGLHEQARMEDAARAQYNKNLQDRLVTLRSGVTTRKYVLGRCRVGGALMFGESILQPASGWVKARSYLDTIHAWAANECSLVGYYFDDEYVPLAAFPGTKYGKATTGRTQETHTVTGSGGAATITLAIAPLPTGVSAYYNSGELSVALTVVSVSGYNVSVSGLPATPVDVTISFAYSIGAKLQHIYKDGDSAQTSSDWGGSPPSPLWTSAHRLRGVAHSRLLMLWDEAVYQSGAPTPTAVLDGHAVDGYPFYDPRFGTYPTFTDNPALLAAWWMTLPRTLGGCGIPSDWIDWSSVAAAANVCDEIITVKGIGGIGYEFIKRYQCNVLLDTGDSPMSNLDRILSAMAGRKAFTAGKYRLVAGAFRSATITITDDDVIGTKPVTLSNATGDRPPVNVVTAEFVDASKAWQASSPDPVRNAAYLASDGVEEPLPMQLQATTDPRQANYLMGVALESARPAFNGQISVGGIGENIALLDTIQLDLTNRDVYSGRTFEVLGITDNWDGTFDLVISEIKATTWALDTERWTPIAQPVPADLSYLWNVSDVSNLNVSLGVPQRLLDGSNVTQVRLTWNAHTQDGVKDGGKIEVRYSRVGDANWTYLAPCEGNATGVSFSASFADRRAYEFNVRARNRIGAVSEHWTPVFAIVYGSEAFVSHTMSITPDPGCENWAAWVLYAGTAPQSVVVGSGEFGGRMWYSSVLSEFYSKPVPIDRTKAYRAICNVNLSSFAQTGNLYLLCAFFDKNGSLIQGSADGAGWPSAGTFHYFGIIGTVPAYVGEYSIAFGAGQTAGIPANAYHVSIGVLAMYNGGTGAVYWQGRIQQLATTELINDSAATEVYEIAVNGPVTVNAGVGKTTVVTWNSPFYPASMKGWTVNATISFDWELAAPTGPGTYVALQTDWNALTYSKVLSRVWYGAGTQSGSNADSWTRLMSSSDFNATVSYRINQVGTAVTPRTVSNIRLRVEVVKR